MGEIYNVYIYGINSSVPEILTDVSFVDEQGRDIYADVGFSLNNLSAELEAFGCISKDAMLVMIGLRDIILSCCPNKRVVHLAKYGKKKRTRKKNLHRAIKILEGMSNGSC